MTEARLEEIEADLVRRSITPCSPRICADDVATIHELIDEIRRLQAAYERPRREPDEVYP